MLLPLGLYVLSACGGGVALSGCGGHCGSSEKEDTGSEENAEENAAGQPECGAVEVHRVSTDAEQRGRLRIRNVGKDKANVMLPVQMGSQCITLVPGGEWREEEGPNYAQQKPEASGNASDLKELRSCNKRCVYKIKEK